MAKERLPYGGDLDLLLHGKVENHLGDPQKYTVYPITRYRNVLNRPRLITESMSVSSTPYGEFSLVTTDVIDVDDDKVATKNP